MTIDEKKHPQASSNSSKKHTSSIYSAAHIGDMISELELSITRLLMDLKDDSGSVLGDLRDHLIELF
jgi:hypothetical protein